MKNEDVFDVQRAFYEQSQKSIWIDFKSCKTVFLIDSLTGTSCQKRAGKKVIDKTDCKHDGTHSNEVIFFTKVCLINVGR